MGVNTPSFRAERSEDPESSIKKRFCFNAKYAKEVLNLEPYTLNLKRGTYESL